MKLLTVDDSAIVRKIIRTAADVLEFEIAEAENGKDALEYLENSEELIDLILLDWNMPVMDGYQLLVELKNSERFKKIPVMMVTTESEKDNIVKAIKAGAIHYMVKPFTIEELTKKIMECLGKGGVW